MLLLQILLAMAGHGVFCIVVLVYVVTVSSKSIKNDRNGSEITELRKAVADLSIQIKDLNSTLQKEINNVMFYAIIRDKSYNLNKDAILVFESVIVNEGSHYDRYDGVFVAPKKGIYMFSWTVSSSGTTYIVTELVVEEKVIASTGEQNGGSGHPSGSMTSFCKMDAGDHAWIRTTGLTSKHVLYSYDNYPQSGFLGILIKQE